MPEAPLRATAAALLALPASLLLALWACAGDGGFDGERAYRDLAAQVEIGARPAGSPEAARTRQLIADRLREAGWSDLEEQRFSAGPPGEAPVPMVNLIATRPGASDQMVLLAAHYDTKRIAGVRFVGANDGASGVAVLLELARVLGPAPGPLTLKLVFFDGEEAFGPSITPSDGLFGSKDLALRMTQAGTLDQIRALILFDMVADRDLNLAIDTRSSPELRAWVEEEAGELVDARQQLALVDDHAPFLERGVDPVLALIDFQYGARRTPGPLWHTAGDDLSAVSAASLGRIGRLGVRLVRRLETAAAASATAPGASVRGAGIGGMLHPSRTQSPPGRPSAVP